MKVRKIIGKNAVVFWEVYGRVNGRGSKQLRRRFERRIDADNFITEQKVESAENALKPKALFLMAEITFQIESAFWLAERGISFSPGHKKRVSDALTKHILPSIGNITLDKINPGLFAQYRLNRLRQSKIKPATVNRETEVMMAILNYSVECRRIPYNPAVGFKKLTEVREEMRFWESAEAADFLEFANQKYPKGSAKRWVYVVYLLALNTALRAGEIWGLQPKDLTQGEEILHIQRQYDLVDRDFRAPKGKKSRYVPCNRVLLSELKGLVDHFKIAKDKTFFQTETGSPIDHDNFTDRYFEKDIVAAKVKKIRFHDLRHTGTTLMIASGLDLKTVKEICGHQDVATTMRYAHLLGDSIRLAARSFSVVPSSEKSAQIQPQLYVVKRKSNS